MILTHRMRKVKRIFYKLQPILSKNIEVWNRGLVLLEMTGMKTLEPDKFTFSDSVVHLEGPREAFACTAIGVEGCRPLTLGFSVLALPNWMQCV